MKTIALLKFKLSVTSDKVAHKNKAPEYSMYNAVSYPSLTGSSYMQVNSNQYTDEWYFKYFNNASKAKWIKNRRDKKPKTTKKVVAESVSLKLQNELNVNGLLRKAHKYYSKYVSTFFEKFRLFDEDLDKEYPLYRVYYEFAKKSPEIFFNIQNIYNIIVSLLSPSFIISTSKKKKKKKKEIVKVTSIAYVKPENRITLSRRLVKLYSRSFSFNHFFLSKTYSLLTLLLKGKNSDLYLKKIQTYSRLLSQRKVKM